MVSVLSFNILVGMPFVLLQVFLTVGMLSSPAPADTIPALVLLGANDSFWHGYGMICDHSLTRKEPEPSIMLGAVSGDYWIQAVSVK